MTLPNYMDTISLLITYFLHFFISFFVCFAYRYIRYHITYPLCMSSTWIHFIYVFYFILFWNWIVIQHNSFKYCSFLICCFAYICVQPVFLCICNHAIRLIFRVRHKSSGVPFTKYEKSAPHFLPETGALGRTLEELDSFWLAVSIESRDHGSAVWVYDVLDETRTK